MQRRFAVLISAGLLASFAGTAYAATAAAGGNTEQSMGVIVALAFSGLSQLGSTGLLIKKYMAKIDKDGEAIPVLVATLEAHKKAMEEHAENLRELYGSRNAHQNDLTEIKALHRFKRCDQIPTPQGGPTT